MNDEALPVFLASVADMIEKDQPYSTVHYGTVLSSVISVPRRSRPLRHLQVTHARCPDGTMAPTSRLTAGWMDGWMDVSHPLRPAFTLCYTYREVFTAGRAVQRTDTNDGCVMESGFPFHALILY